VIWKQLWGNDDEVCRKEEEGKAKKDLLEQGDELLKE